MAAARAPLGPGTVLQGTYQILRAVGAGGMGQVFEARHARLPGRFAIKVLTTRVAEGSPDFLRFQREAEVASSLRHPNIVQVVDFNQADDGSPYIVMEFLEGADLRAVLTREGRLPADRALAIVEQVASALAAAHGRGVVHRDLKPENVFLSPVAGENRDHAKVVDFGTSKVKTALSLTGESGLLGTPQYMAPEQAEGRADAIDGRSDQFALAAIVYEMLSGRRAFIGDSIPAVLYRIACESPPPLVSGLPAAVDGVLQKAMAKRKQDRYATVLEFALALRSSLGAAAAAPDAVKPAVTVRLPGRAPDLPARRPRRPARVLIGALGLAAALASAAAVVVAVVIAVLATREPDPAPPAPPAVVVREPAPSPPVVEPVKGPAPALQIKPARRPGKSPRKPVTPPRPSQESFIVDF